MSDDNKMPATEPTSTAITPTADTPAEAAMTEEKASSTTATQTAPEAHEAPKKEDEENPVAANDNEGKKEEAVAAAAEGAEKTTDKPEVAASINVPAVEDKKEPPPARPTNTDTTAEDAKRPATTTSATTATSATSTETQPPAKRQRVEDTTSTTTSTSATTSSTTANTKEEEAEGEEEVVDICSQIGFKGGDRLEVEWQLEDEQGKPTTRWWGCTLQDHDGRTSEGVAIRVLDYDPYPQGGFPDRSQEDVIFLTHDLMISPDEEAEFRYRSEGQVNFSNEEEARAAINAILMNTLNKHADKWKQLDRASQMTIANGIAQKKELLVTAIMNHSKTPVITGTDMHDILNGIMQPTNNSNRR